AKNAYKILISEVMLQQTQVARVLEKYPEFLQVFPTIKTLADAPLAQVLAVWQGMGYNRRALALKRLAEEIVAKHQGKIPNDRAELESLPGIGSYTAGAVRAFAFNKPEVFIETNIRRVFIHHFFGDKRGVNDKEIFPLIERTLDCARVREWYWALMDYGAHLPKITETNPNRKSRHYTRQKPFEGSHRQLRGKMLKLLSTTKGEHTLAACARELSTTPEKTQGILNELAQEGFIQKHGKNYTIKN
ncbi:MAG: HhH-GPD family protein, partial [Minisyncoccota bacterium]